MAVVLDKSSTSTGTLVVCMASPTPTAAIIRIRSSSQKLVYWEEVKAEIQINNSEFVMLKAQKRVEGIEVN